MLSTLELEFFIKIADCSSFYHYSCIVLQNFISIFASRVINPAAPILTEPCGNNYSPLTITINEETYIFHRIDRADGLHGFGKRANDGLYGNSHADS